MALELKAKKLRLGNFFYSEFNKKFKNLMSRNSGNMGNPAELEANQRPTSQTKATFSGATAFLGVLSLIITIISVAVPHWGSFGPGGQSYFQAGKFVFLLIQYIV